MELGLLRGIFHGLGVPFQIQKDGIPIGGQALESFSHTSRISERHKKKDTDNHTIVDFWGTLIPERLQERRKQWATSRTN